VSAIRSVIFDVDGVLIDATDWHFEALNRALNPYAASVSYEEHVCRLLGLTTKAKLELLVTMGRVPASGCASILDSKRRYFRQIVLERCRPNHALRNVLQELSQRRIVLGAASNATRESVEEMLALAGLRSYLNAVVGGDEVIYPKPDPAIYVKCAATLGVDQSACLVVEDGKYGIQAATAARMRVLIIKSPGELTLTNLLDQLSIDLNDTVAN
jgi:beta-phosphoglucomutase